MSEQQETTSTSTPVSLSQIRRVCQGSVMAIGGAEQKSKYQDSGILTRFVELAGNAQARIAVIPTASEEQEAAGRRYVEVFGKFGAKSVEVLEVYQRSDANDEPALELLRRATGIFVTGGDQARLVSLLVGTKAVECIRQRNIEGVLVAGTSAGASILASHVLAGGTGVVDSTNETAAKKSMVELVAGFGLVQDLIIDQHFSQRGRLGRLLAAFAANPGLIGIGLDEDTAVLIDRDGVLETLGSGMVTIVDGRRATSDYFQREMGEVVSVVDSLLHVLGPGRKFDLDQRRPLPFPEAA